MQSQQQAAFELPDLSGNAKLKLSKAWAANLRGQGINSFVLANGNTYDIPSNRDFNHKDIGHGKQIEFLQNAIRYAQGSSNMRLHQNYVREAHTRLGREGAGKPKRGLTSFTDSRPQREEKEGDEESVATTLLAPTVVMDPNSLASLQRRAQAQFLDTSTLQGAGPATPSHVSGSSTQHALSSTHDPAEVMFGQPASPSPLGQAVPQDQNSSTLPSEPLVDQVSRDLGGQGGDEKEEKDREQKYFEDDTVEIGDDAGASSSGMAGGAGGGNVLGSLGVPTYSQDDPNAQLYNDTARRGLDPINRAIQGFTGRFPAVGQAQENFLNEAVGEMTDVVASDTLGLLSRADVSQYNDLISAGVGLLAEFRDRTGLDPAQTPEARAIATAAAQALQRGGQSQGAGGVGNIAAGPAIQQEAKNIDANGDGTVSKREFDLAKYNKALAYIHQFNPKASQRMGSTRIRRAKPRRARMDKMQNQVHNVQQGIANYAAYRDVFNTTFG